MSARATLSLIIAVVLAFLFFFFCPRGPTPPGTTTTSAGSTGVAPGTTPIVPGTTPSGSTAVVPGATPSSSAILQVDGGLEHTCALVQAGDVYCWGSAFNAQLGYGNTDTIGDDETPSSAGPVNVGGTVIQIAAGSGHTCALLDTGAVRCWGLGVGGRLGYGNTDTIGDDEDPATAGDVNVGGTVTQIAAGGSFTCALLSTGTVRCWGANPSGELGYGNSNRIGDDEAPATAGDVDVGGTVTQITAGGNHACALLSGGTVRCWGLAFNGQLGYGNRDRVGDDETPASAGDVDVGGSVSEISAGGNNTCVRLDTGAVRCWGFGTLGQLGYGNQIQIGDDETPASAGDVDVGGPVTQISVGAGHICALLGTSVRCWGDGDAGRLGYGNTNSIGDDENPSTAGDVNVGGTVTQIAAAGQHTCALLTTGRLRCWGYALEGFLGYANTLNIGDDEDPATAGDVPVP